VLEPFLFREARGEQHATYCVLGEISSTPVLTRDAIFPTLK
jgi:hypothetical protein